MICQEKKCDKNARFYIPYKEKYVWCDHKSSQYVMEEGIEIIDPQTPRNILKNFDTSLENFQIFSQEHNNESDQLEVNDMCTTMREELKSINEELGEAEQNNEAFKYKVIEKEAMKLLMNLNNQKIYIDYCLKRTNDYNLGCLSGSNEGANLQIKTKKMSKCLCFRIFAFECPTIRIL